MASAQDVVNALASIGLRIVERYPGVGWVVSNDTPPNGNPGTALKAIFNGTAVTIQLMEPLEEVLRIHPSLVQTADPASDVQIRQG